MVGAKRDPGWGTILLLGLGGIWVEALGDVQMLPGTPAKHSDRRSAGTATFEKTAGRCTRRAAGRCRCHRQTVLAIGRLMQAVPEITEIDVNPLMVHAKGKGATALDALIVTA